MPCSVMKIDNGNEISLGKIFITWHLSFSEAFSLDSNVHSSEFSFLWKCNILSQNCYCGLFSLCSYVCIDLPRRKNLKDYYSRNCTLNQSNEKFGNFLATYDMKNDQISKFTFHFFPERDGLNSYF